MMVVRGVERGGRSQAAEIAGACLSVHDRFRAARRMPHNASRLFRRKVELPTAYQSRLDTKA